jgi:hypothetical protein
MLFLVNAVGLGVDARRARPVSIAFSLPMPTGKVSVPSFADGAVDAHLQKSQARTAPIVRQPASPALELAAGEMGPVLFLV